MLLSFSYLREGGEPGCVLEGELLSGGALIFRGEMQAKQILLGLGPMFSPPQLVHGGVGGGVH